MSWQTPREQAFNLAGPFLAKRGNHGAGDIILEQDRVYSAEQFAEAGLSARHIQRMYAAYWIEMAPVDATPEPLDRDGDGKKGGSLTDVEQIALQRAGYTLDDFLSLHDDARPNVLADAMADHGEEAALAASKGLHDIEGPPVAETDEKAPDGPEIEPEAGSEADGGAGGSPTVDAEAGAAPVQGETATAPADTKIAAYRSFGFGRYFAVNAAGEKLGAKLNKAEAEGLASRDNVPLLAQRDALPATE